ncbi:GGDEF domain-containing protein [Thiocystis minor]|uniref:GGDEF domain-containing protein n=1 Tax=Thiocystis minor TaxID=61597 RepID=UPI001F5DC820|nr:GGDEF domain-containing protein [Thiocystis minor]
MIDLDDFKQVNDRFGHAGGDATLVAFAGLLKSQVRAADLSGRFGGEEFVLYMLDADLLASSEAAERLRVQIAQLRPLEADFRVTASFGVTELRPGETAETLLIRADDLLYRAKAEGRNRVIAEARGA